MNIITTFSPSEKSRERQLYCLKTWKNYSKNIISINHESEIDRLNDFDVKFVSPKKTGKEDFGIDLIPITEILNYIISENEPYLLINSDIEIKELPVIEKEGLYVFNRYDYSDKSPNPKIFLSGFDAYYITPEIAKAYKESKLCLGRCHWDYLLPYVAIKKEVPVYTIKKPYFLHKTHDLNYNFESWKKTAKIFAEEAKIFGNADTVSKTAYKRIYAKIINI